MNLVLNIYTDDELTEIKRVAEADRMKIPYRVSMYLIKSLEGIDVNNQNEILNFIGKSTDKLDKVIKATFKVSESELECIDTMDLVPIATELYNFAIEKIKGIKQGDNSKNLVETA